MAKTRDEQINDLVTTLSRVRREQADEYPVRIKQYLDMRNGGDGGPWRAGADTSLRELHYKNWKDEDFQTVLELLDELPFMDEAERAEHFKHERGIWNNLKKTLGA